MFESKSIAQPNEDWPSFLAEEQACSFLSDAPISDPITNAELRPHTINRRNGCTIIVVGGTEVGKVYRIYEREGEGTRPKWSHTKAPSSMREMGKYTWEHQKDCIADLVKKGGAK